ncbi:MAG: tRNA pseudouridine(55) synthase TruB [Proteobacteria bacterium]|nr:tRNA pseudouridine(55) synthase TruB [Pseudomonadota bacterium]MBI3499027.1 tRNA pseudouridine(55) synthase TruB [Pseudomonadota bacterium]
MSRRKGNKVDGWLIIDKPSGMTSTRVVGAVRRLFEAAKAGHGGTLDPLATGVLPIAFGEATKTVPYVMDATKVYRFTIRWGEARTTDDAEGEVTAVSAHRPTADAIQAALPRFTGLIQQTPPAYSALKIAGERAYDLARADLPVHLEPRPVMIERFSLVSQPAPDLAVFEVVSGKGAYMRALARDLGRVLGSLGHVAQLRRLRVGPFAETRAISLDSLTLLGHSPAAFEHLLPVETALDDIPALALTGTEANRLRQGQAVALFRKSDLDRLGDLQDGDLLCATAAGRPVALARFDAGRICPVRVLNL